jgi:hypothetical protein
MNLNLQMSKGSWATAQQCITCFAGASPGFHPSTIKKRTKDDERKIMIATNFDEMIIYLLIYFYW